MSPEEEKLLRAFLREIVGRRWSDDGACRSCGWHASLHEYDDDDLLSGLDMENGVIELPCLSDFESRSYHRGVRVNIRSTDADPR